MRVYCVFCKKNFNTEKEAEYVFYGMSVCEAHLEKIEEGID